MEVFFCMNEFDVEIDRFMLDCTAKGLSVKTMKSYEQSLKLFSKWLYVEYEIDSPKQVKAEHLRSYMKNLGERGKYEWSSAENPNNNPKAREDYGKKISMTTVANYTRNIKVFFAYLYQEQIIRTNPMKNVKNVKSERKMKVMLEDNELKQFFRAFDVTKFDQYRDWIIARLIFDTGTETFLCLAVKAFLILVNISAIGSIVILIFPPFTNLISLHQEFRLCKLVL